MERLNSDEITQVAKEISDEIIKRVNTPAEAKMVLVMVQCGFIVASVIQNASPKIEKKICPNCGMP